MEENFNLIRWDEVNDGELDVENFELKLKSIYNVEYFIVCLTVGCIGLKLMIIMISFTVTVLTKSIVIDFRFWCLEDIM